MKNNKISWVMMALLVSFAVHPAMADTKTIEEETDATEQVEATNEEDEASDEDSSKGESKSERNVMLNASDASKPREIQIGLPATAGGTDIFEDGLPTAYYFWPLMPYMHWRSSVGHEQMGLKNLSEASLTSGNVGYAVDSYTRLGGDKFEGHLNYSTNQFGMNKIDMNVAGPIAKGWSYTGSVFQNFDPGSTDLKFMEYSDRTQIYKGGLTKRWNDDKSQISFLYKYTKSSIMSDPYGPFYYVGDGSVEEMNGFDLGHDSYLPSDGKMQIMDVKTGEIINTSYDDRTTSYTSEYSTMFKHQFNNGMNLNVNARYTTANTQYTISFLSGLDNVTAASGYTYSDGSAYEGDVQNRYMLYYQGENDEFLSTAELSKRVANHSLRLGLNEWYDKVELGTMTSNFAHTVSANAQRLSFNNQEFWGFNTGAEYYDGHENKLALYFSDDWRVNNRFNLSYGLRAELYSIGGSSPMNASADATNNSRTENFSLKKDGVTLTDFSHTWLNPIGTIRANYDIAAGIGVSGEYLFNRQRPRLENFAGSDIPDLAPVDVNLGIFGVYYKNSWINVVSNLTYITKSNYKTRLQFTKAINGISETQTKAVMYDIATLGWTTDAVITPFKGASLHLLATIQKPQYKDFTTTLQFSDGSSQTYDYSDKTVTNISKILLEIDPSYAFNDWRVWMSFRYFGERNANKTNTIKFGGRWETFAGVDYTVNKHLALGMSVVNLLNQKGAQGDITAADLMEDTSMFKNYLMSGSYIRPFTLEFTAKFTF